MILKNDFKKWPSFTLAILLGFLMYNACNKDQAFNSELRTQNLQNYSNASIDQQIDIINPQRLEDWSSGTYLVFNNESDFWQKYDELASLYAQESYSASQPYPSEYSLTLKDTIFGSPESFVLNSYEENNNHISMRRFYEEYENTLLNRNFDPSEIPDIPIIDDVLATLLSPAGIVQVGSEIYFHNGSEFSSVPIANKSELRDKYLNDDFYTPFDGEDVVIKPDLRGDCRADFDMDVNYSAKEVFLEYTGTSHSDPHSRIKWSIGDGSNDYVNEDHVSHQFPTRSEYQICVYYEERRTVTDSIWKYTLTGYVEIETDVEQDDSTVVTEVIKVPQFDSTLKIINTVRTVCADTKCKSVDFESCNPYFSYAVGSDGVIQFTDKSEVEYGTITGWYWQFGDGETSTQQNPTHTYDCNKEYSVNLTITSDACNGGTKVASDKINAKSIVCCDVNPDSDWKDVFTPDKEKKIKYRYDLGTWFGKLWNSTLKGKIKYYEKNNKGKFKKAKGNLDVEFIGNIYRNNNDQCECDDPAIVDAQPEVKYAKSHTFKDKLGGFHLGKDKAKRIKREDPILIEYYVDGHLYVTQNTVEEPGFVCEQ